MGLTCVLRVTTGMSLLKNASAGLKYAPLTDLGIHAFACASSHHSSAPKMNDGIRTLASVLNSLTVLTSLNFLELMDTETLKLMIAFVRILDSVSYLNSRTRQPFTGTTTLVSAFTATLNAQKVSIWTQ